MFILRKITKERLVSNKSLGESYNYICRETNYKEFSDTYKILFGESHVADLDENSDSFSVKCYAFIIYNDGKDIDPLYKGQWNYIMTDTGKTFDNVSYK